MVLDQLRDYGKYAAAGPAAPAAWAGEQAGERLADWSQKDPDFADDSNVGSGINFPTGQQEEDDSGSSSSGGSERAGPATTGGTATPTGRNNPFNLQVDDGSISGLPEDHTGTPSNDTESSGNRTPTGANNPMEWQANDGDIVGPPPSHVGEDGSAPSLQNWLDKDGLDLNPLGDTRLDPTDQSFSSDPTDDKGAQADEQNEYPLLTNYAKAGQLEEETLMTVLSANEDTSNVPENDPAPDPAPPGVIGRGGSGGRGGQGGSDGSGGSLLTYAVALGAVGLGAYYYFYHYQ